MIFRNVNDSLKSGLPIFFMILAVWIDTLPIIPFSWQSLPGRALLGCAFAYLWQRVNYYDLIPLLAVGLFADIVNDRVYGETPLLLLILFLLLNFQRGYASAGGSLSYLLFMTANVIILDIIAYIYSYAALDVSFVPIGIAAGIITSIMMGSLWYIPIRIVRRD